MSLAKSGNIKNVCLPNALMTLCEYMMDYGDDAFRQQAEAFIALGFKLGFGGAMTYSGSQRIRQLAASLPLSALVLETDAPDIRPAWAPDTPNAPANLHRFAQVLAELRGEPLDEVIAATTANARAALLLR